MEDDELDKIANGKQRSTATAMAVFATVLSNLRSEVRDISDRLNSGFITKDQHELLRNRVAMLEKIVYGLVSIILITVIGAVVSLVVTKK